RGRPWRLLLDRPEAAHGALGLARPVVRARRAERARPAAGRPPRRPGQGPRGAPVAGRDRGHPAAGRRTARDAALPPPPPRLARDSLAAVLTAEQPSGQLAWGLSTSTVNDRLADR